MKPLEVALDGQASQEIVVNRSADPTKLERTITNVSAATLTISWPSQHDGSTPCVLICPGGGYGMLVIDKEGHDLARWLNANGFVAAVLKYRLPQYRGEIEPYPVLDARHAMRLLRLHADEWQIRPDAIGIMGSSAGGHLAATLSNHFDLGRPHASDPLEQQSCRPDFQILLYPVISFADSIWLHSGSRRNLIGNNADEKLREKYSNEKQVTGDTPPAFIVHAVDDGIASVEHSRHYAEALSKAEVPHEYLEIPTGGHGFGLGVNGGEPLVWPPRCLLWIDGLFPPRP